MNASKITRQQLFQLVSTYWQWRWLWASTTAVFAVLALAYVVVIKTDTWVASQGLIVRDEANGAVMRLGRFQSQTEMKAAQETIHEMARNAQVLKDALTEVGREQGWLGWLVNNNQPPTASEIESLARGGITVRAPRGAELGTTEVIYLDVKQNSKQRALQLNKAVCDALENRLQQVRKARADGVLGELITAKETAELSLEKATEHLRRMEAEAGADLSDLRGMTDSASGGSTARQVLDSIKSEMRQAELSLQQVETDLQLAIDSYDNPDQLLVTPSSLVNSQGGLKTLRDGLAAATINTSNLRGRYTENHPLVEASLHAERKIREQLRQELGLSVQSLRKDVEISKERVAKLKEQQESLESRLEKIASIRADYSNVVNEVRARSLQLQESERELGQAKASRDAALTSSLITRIDKPMIGEKPLGPGRMTILAGATISGLFFGLGLVFLLTPLEGGMRYGRRRMDYSGNAGRRATDSLRGDGQPASADVLVPQQSANLATSAVPDRRSNASTVNPTTPTFEAVDITKWVQPEKLLRMLRSWWSARRVSRPSRFTVSNREVPQANRQSKPSGDRQASVEKNAPGATTADNQSVQGLSLATATLLPTAEPAKPTLPTSNTGQAALPSAADATAQIANNVVGAEPTSNQSATPDQPIWGFPTPDSSSTFIVSSSGNPT